eukprot:TRINITY_DN3390_c0_g1_i1.p1 TRINITY_DN3390_c0_g1~~TRINITY_DN3390_c0_g1_i1.p1  ORF type:complete len:316 (-),score=83.35 TRINITY_DN3390_c0_g1_i1:45-926(-)
MVKSGVSSPVYSEEARKAHIARFASSDDAQAMRELIQTGVVYIPAMLFILFFSASMPLWINVLAMTVAGGASVRAFVLFHDACHMSLFRSPSANRRAANILSLVVLTPFERWRDRHNHHHNVFGDLGEPDLGQTIQFTRKEFNDFPLYKKIGWRIIRDPFVFFFGVPMMLWGLEYPLRYGDRYTFLAWVIHATLVTQCSSYFGYMLIFAGAFGTILFHLQHAVNSAYRADSATHSSARAAFEGSTCLAVAWPITWVTCNIEYHHIHHYSTRVPSYKLAECHHSAPKGLSLIHI